MHAASLSHGLYLLVRVRAGGKLAPFPSACFSCTRIIMPKQSKTVHKKSRGRPAGKTYSETIPARLEPATVASLDAWAVANDVSRSEAIRRLVELGLTVKMSAKQPSSLKAARAKELASKTIEKIIDPSAPPKNEPSVVNA